MKGKDGFDPPLIGTRETKLIPNSFGDRLSIWKGRFTPQTIENASVISITVKKMTTNEKLNAIILYNADEILFNPDTIEFYHNEQVSKNYTMTLSSGLTETVKVLLPVVDIVDGVFDARPVTVSLKLGEQQEPAITTVDPNLGDGLLMYNVNFTMPFNLGDISPLVTATLDISTKDSIHVLEPIICRSTYVKNTAQICSDKAGCVSTTLWNPPLEPSAYLPLIAK